MNHIDFNYLKGISTALQTNNLCKIANIDNVVRTVGKYLESSLEKTAEDIPGEPSEQELQQVSASGISDNDIQAAAKVIKLIAEMKQQSDMIMGNMAQAQQGAQPGQPGQQQGQPQMPAQAAPAGPQAGQGQPQQAMTGSPDPFSQMM